MADTVNTDTIFAGTNRHVIHIQNKSDGTGESAVSKLDISGLIGPNGAAPSKVVLEEVNYNIVGFSSVQLFWDHTANDEMVTLPTGSGYLDFRSVGGKVDPASAGGTGDVLLTTVGASATSTYDITLAFRLKD